MVEKRIRVGKSRLSVGLTPQELEELIALKERHDVSLAWIGRQAILEFVAKYRSESSLLPLKVGTPEGR